MRRVNVSWALLPLVLSTCAHTSMSSMVAPDVRGRVFHNVLVVGNFADLGIRQDAEYRLAGRSVPGHYQFVPSVDLFFPGREYSSEELRTILRQHSIDATLVITPGQSGATSGYVPPTYTSSCSAWTSAGCTQVTTSQAGGFSYSRPWQQFSATLYDATSGSSVWVASAGTGGNAFAHALTLVRSMVDKTAERLTHDGLVR